MRRRVTRRDRLGEQVADLPLAEELRQVLLASMPETDARVVLHFLESDEPLNENILRMLATRLARVRENLDYRDRLATYLYDGQRPERPGCCRGCTRELEPRQERKAGRPRKYCSNSCRQLAYRNRQRAASQRRRREFEPALRKDLKWPGWDAVWEALDPEPLSEGAKRIPKERLEADAQRALCVATDPTSTEHIPGRLRSARKAGQWRS